MNTIVYFGMSVALGLVAWFTIFAAIIWPKMKGQPKIQQLKSLTAISFFRYFATTFLIVGLPGLLFAMLVYTIKEPLPYRVVVFPDGTPSNQNAAGVEGGVVNDEAGALRADEGAGRPVFRYPAG